MVRAKNYFVKGTAFRTAAMNTEKRAGNYTLKSIELVEGISEILGERLQETRATKLKSKKKKKNLNF